MGSRTTAHLAASRLESEFDCTVVAASAIGANARGTYSRDSDLDLFALGIPSQRQQALERDRLYREFETYDDLGPGVDVHLWSQQATYDGIMDDDPTVIHAFDSPLQIYTPVKIVDDWNSLSQYTVENCNRYSLYRHYRSMASKNYQQYINDGRDATVKRLHLVLDSLLRARYIEDEAELPPYEQQDLQHAIEDRATADSPTHRLTPIYESTQSDAWGLTEISPSTETESAPVETPYTTFDDVYEDIETLLDDDPSDYGTEYGTGADAQTVASLLRSIATTVWTQT